MYELWFDSNGYGLVQMLSKDKQNAGRDDIRRVTYGGEVVETRDSDFRNVLIYEDFVNYKASLAAVKESQTAESQKVDWNLVGRGSREETVEPAERKLDMLLSICPELAAEDLQVPDSCVDWARVKQEVSVR